ncbi:MAG: type II secretion system minor pseudopilin GspK [Pseudomonadota bacterium]|nr:type II secretion system minor pseudopilin GspK [Pseudomonadota bacterium]
MRRADRPSERGAALLTVLLLVAVIAVIAGTALERLRMATKIGINGAAMQQARAYAMAAEVLAVVKVSDLLARDPGKVTLVGGWSGQPYPLPIDNGTVTASVVDGGNCFNLNGLVTPISPGVNASYTPARLEFARLIRLVAPDTSSPESIADAATDWIDSDTSPLPGGGEDGAYAGLATPYRTPNTLMADPGELRAVKGVTPDLYARLRPWLCTLPVAELPTLNVNTLQPEQAPLIAMLFPDTLSIEAARQVLLKRPVQGFAETGAFWSQPALSGVTAVPGAIGQTGVTTKWFALTVKADVAGTDMESHGLIDARRLPAQLATRQWGEPS